MAQPIIDKVIIQTIERNADRHQRVLGAAAMMKIPDDRLLFSIGQDNLDFDDDMERITEAAKADGFEWASEYALGTKTEHVQQTPATACQAWNFGRNLQYIIDNNLTALILWDDKMIAVSWSKLNRVLQSIHNIPTHEFYAAQLVIRGHEDEVILEPVTNTERKEQSLRLFHAITNGLSIEDYGSIFFTRGFAGYDESIVFSPVGAQWMLNLLASSTEFYTFVDHFIKIEMPYHAEKANKMGKGVYCPAEIGYQFVREIQKMGTTTDWAHEDSTMYEGSREITKINYIRHIASVEMPVTPKPSETDEVEPELPSDLKGQLLQNLGMPSPGPRPEIKGKPEIKKSALQRQLAEKLQSKE